MKQFLILFKKEMMEIYRTKKMLIILIAFLLMAFASPLLAKITPELMKSLEETGFQVTMPDPTIVDSYSQLVQNFSQICLFVVIIVFGGMIVNEKKKGLYTTLINNGVKKKNFIFAKIISQIVTVTCIYIFSIIFFSVCNYIFFEEFVVTHWFLSVFMMYLYIIFIMCCLSFYSTICKGSGMSITFGIMTALFIGMFDLFKFGKYLPGHLLTASMNIFSDTAYLNYIYATMGIALLISAVLIALSVKMCSIKE